MQKKNFVVKVSRRISEFRIMNVPSTSAQRARHIAEHVAETDRGDLEYEIDPASRPGKITTEIIADK